MSRSLVFFVAVLCLFVGSMVIWYAVQVTRQGATQHAAASGVSEPKLDPNRKLDSFVLTERSGDRFTSESLKGRGRIWVANFFFSRCPSVCWKQNQKMLDFEREFGQDGVEFVSITVDPANDTPSVLREYATRLGAGKNWYFLTGNFDYIKKVGQDIFQVTVGNEEHSENLILVDGTGNLRGYYHWDDDAQLADLRKEIKKLLAQRPGG